MLEGEKNQSIDVKMRLIDYKIDIMSKQFDSVNIHLKEIAQCLSNLLVLQNKHDALEDNFTKSKIELEKKLEDATNAADEGLVMKSQVRAVVWVITLIFGIAQSLVVWYIQNTQQTINELKTEISEVSKMASETKIKFDLYTKGR